MRRRELVGQYANKGRTWRPGGDPRRVEVHDFPGEAGKAVPTGSTTWRRPGWVSVGNDGDTAAFAVVTIRRWWTTIGRPGYPDATNC